jgi:hypothetical protein
LQPLLDLRDWQKRHELAQQKDKADYDARSIKLIRNQDLMLQALSECDPFISNGTSHNNSSIDAKHDDMMAMMPSLQQRIKAPNPPGGSEREFCQMALNALVVSSRGAQPVIEDWTISRFDVDKDQKLGEGGLSV